MSSCLSVDPLAGKFPSMSPYNFVGNSPLLFVDIDGRVFVTYIKVKQKDEKTGKIKKIKYKVVFNGTKTTMQKIVKGKPVGEIVDYSTGTNQFVDNMVDSYSYIVENGADIDGAMQKIASMNEEVVVVEKRQGGSYLNGVIEIDFRYGLTIYDDNGTDKSSDDKKIGNQSPALGFWSEVYHAYIDLVDTETKEELNGDLQKEEEYVHLDKEHAVIDALRTKEAKRTQYQPGDAMPVKTKNATSTEKKNKKDK